MSSQMESSQNNTSHMLLNKCSNSFFFFFQIKKNKHKTHTHIQKSNLPPLPLQTPSPEANSLVQMLPNLPHAYRETSITQKHTILKTE